ncbi:hypothetical protein GE061_003267 [Apolygus lucorum]|uniref:SCP domain-containing protein n=1 Tax=Apolygus lucorum TaxID=248454 RepID=A0A6A4JL64_APOLU|nr:hypothetical protein GE061_003267 [Apolygus lucorum]
MWRELLLILFLAIILRIGTPQDSTTQNSTTSNGNVTTDTTDNATTENRTEPPPNPRCLQPTDRKEGFFPDFYIKPVLMDIFTYMRRILPLGATPKKNVACILPRLKWNKQYEFVALSKAMKCPTPDTGPHKLFYNQTENYGEFIYFGTPNSTEAFVSNDSDWTADIDAMSKSEWESTTKKYRKGAWDPGFQIIWSNTTSVGCALVQYNNSDLADLSRIFKTNVSGPMILNTLVCLFSPIGCVEGEIPFVCKPIPTVGPLPPFISPRTLYPPTVKPFSSAKKLGVDKGFNFGTLSIAYILIRNLPPILRLQS